MQLHLVLVLLGGRLELDLVARLGSGLGLGLGLKTSALEHKQAVLIH